MDLDYREDKDLFTLLEQEKKRQEDSIILIPSENYTSRGVMQLLGSNLSMKYSEGYPFARSYVGCDYIDEIEKLAQDRAREAF